MFLEVARPVPPGSGAAARAAQETAREAEGPMPQGLFEVPELSASVAFLLVRTGT